MKKVLLVAAVACMAMTSCKKNYTCECTTTYTGGGGSTTPFVGSTTINDTKSKAEDACNSMDQTSTAGSITSTTDCKIK